MVNFTFIFTFLYICLYVDAFDHKLHCHMYWEPFVCCLVIKSLSWFFQMNCYITCVHSYAVIQGVPILYSIKGSILDLWKSVVNARQSVGWKLYPSSLGSECLVAC